MVQADEEAAPFEKDTTKLVDDFLKENPMTDGKHTPGPWTSYPCNLERYSRVITANGAMVQIAMTKEVYGDRRTYEPGEETTANARLIAAAPDLLEAAKLVIAWYEAENDHKGTDFWQRVAMCRESEDALRAAIAKATGAARATEGSAT